MTTPLEALDRAAKNVSQWPEWKKIAGNQLINLLREDYRIIRERDEYIRLYGEQ